ncbi:MAG: hypothetical protein QM572_08835 [Nocardioides sp.]|uniref:hypothetical protein n=1 Tax=Nocardioides sp. TaxID=35761 RepID=UPI0039E3F8BB
MAGVRRVEHGDLEETRRDMVAMLTALEGHHGCTFTLQWLAFPSVGDARGGRIEVSLIVAIPGTSGGALVEEITDDVDDVLNGPPGLWTFDRVTDPAELEAILNPFEPAYVAEIVRREEDLPGREQGPDSVQGVGQYL